MHVAPRGSGELLVHVLTRMERGREALLLWEGSNEVRCLFLCNCVSGTRLHLTETCVLDSHVGRFDNKVRSLQKLSNKPTSSLL